MAASLWGPGIAGEVADTIIEGVTMSAASCELIGRVDRIADSGEAVILLVFEKYYMRSSNRASLSVLVTGAEGSVNVDIIGAGGGTGVFFRFSWGTEESFEATACGVLERIGFTRV